MNYTKMTVTGGEIHSSWARAGIDIGTKIEKHSTTCPKCSSQRKKSNEKCLTVDVPNTSFHCNHCNFHGIINPKGEKKFIVPEQLAIDPKTMSLDWVEYFSARGITPNTLYAAGVFEHKAWIPAEKAVVSCCVFPYVNEVGVTVNYKNRSMLKGFSACPNAELRLWNLDKCNFTKKKTLIITEGEIDTLSLRQVGFVNAASVPNGASGGTAKLEYIDNCADILFADDSIEFILAVDNDPKGKMLEIALAKRLGVDKCKRVNWPADRKDCNEVLVKDGPEALKKLMLENVSYFPIDGVHTLDTDYDILLDVNKNGRVPYDSLYFGDKFDSLMTFNRRGHVTLISATPQTGKSDFTFEVALRLAIIHDWKFAILSPETGDTDEVYEALMQKAIGKPINPNTAKKHNVKVASREEMDFVKGFLKERFYVIDPYSIDNTLGGYLAICEKLKKKHGINGVIADPYNSFENAFSDVNLANHLSKDLSSAKEWTVRNDCHLFIVAHPRALKLGERMVSEYQINGGAAWGNKVDNIILGNRQDQTAMFENHLGDKVEWSVRKCKKSFAGKRGNAGFLYYVPTGTYCLDGENPKFLTISDLLAIRNGLMQAKEFDAFVDGEEAPF